MAFCNAMQCLSVSTVSDNVHSYVTCIGVGDGLHDGTIILNMTNHNSLAFTSMPSNVTYLMCFIIFHGQSVKHAKYPILAWLELCIQFLAMPRRGCVPALKIANINNKIAQNTTGGQTILARSISNAPASP